MTTKLIPGEYLDEFETGPDLDTATAVTIHIPNRRMAHEPHEYCWCEPDIIEVYDDDGEIIDYEYEHRLTH
jgi:hypothetical protein